MQTSRVKTNLAAFFGAIDVIRHEFVREKQTAKGKFHKNAINNLMARVHCVRPEFLESGS
jgi:hypothetical protein